MNKYIDAEKLKTEIDKILAKAEKDEKKALLRKDANGHLIAVTKTAICARVKKSIASLQEKQDMGEVSDGYHTFNELYYYRMLYNAAFFNLLPKNMVHKSKKHHAGEECFGGDWFIVMANLPTGQISNHYELKDWDLFKVPEKEFADKWDGHTSQEAADRLHKYLQNEQSEVDLDKEYAEFVEADPVYSKLVNGLVGKAIARHFYELGKNARKEE